MKRHVSVSAVVDDAVRAMVAEVDPTRIILFGSATRGDMAEGSDLDFLVVLPKVENRFLEIARLTDVLAHLPLPVDVLVYSEDEIRERGHLKGTALHHALREGRVLWEAAQSRSLSA